MRVIFHEKLRLLRLKEDKFLEGEKIKAQRVRGRSQRLQYIQLCVNSGSLSTLCSCFLKCCDMPFLCGSCCWGSCSLLHVSYKDLWLQTSSELKLNLIYGVEGKVHRFFIYFPFIDMKSAWSVHGELTSSSTADSTCTHQMFNVFY